jgi:mono/diheme cytochrome c family protein
MAALKLTLAILTATVAACGGGGDAPAPTQPAPPAPAPAPPPSTAPDAVNGKALYLQHCSACHRTAPDERVLMAAGDGAVIVQAIGIVRIMNFLSPTIRPAQAQDIALWLEDPR